MALLTWRSSKTPRQVLGSSGAEVQAVTEAEDTVFRTRAYLAEMGGVIFQRESLHEATYFWSSCDGHEGNI